MGYQPTTLNELKPGDCVERFDGSFNTVLGIFTEKIVNLTFVSLGFSQLVFKRTFAAYCFEEDRVF